MPNFKFFDKMEEIVYTYNNRPHRGLNNLTPMEAEKKENHVKVKQIMLTPTLTIFTFDSYQNIYTKIKI